MSNENEALTLIMDWLYATDPLANPEVEGKARLVLLDTLGCFIASLRHPEPKALVNRLCEVEPGSVRLPGVDVGMSPISAAFSIALGACWDEACEGLARAHGRPGLHAAPAALALALADNRTLGSMLAALVVGYEVGGRMGEALRIKPGLHVDGAWGALAAAAAAARILSDEPALALRAVQTAACQIPFSLYDPVPVGATARNTYAGNGVSLGLRSALSVEAGITAPDAAIGSYGALALDLGPGLPAFAPAGDYVILEGYLKPFAAVRHVHYGATCALDWRRQQGPDTAAIGAISLRIYDEAIRYCGNRKPATAIQAQFSLSFGLARALRSGDLGPDAYTPEALGDSEVRRLESLVELQNDQKLTASGKRGAALTVSASGCEVSYAVGSISGDPDRPLEATEVQEKFTRYAGPLIGNARALTIADGILNAPLNRNLQALLHDAKDR